MTKAARTPRRPARAARTTPACAESPSPPKASASLTREERTRTLVNKIPPGKDHDEASAELIAEGVAMNSFATASYSKALGDLDLTAVFVAIMQEAKKVQEGDLGGMERMLVAQATALNAVFTQMVYQTSKTTLVSQIELFMRLALKAQSQCRATIETLGELKNPPVFAKQANIANGPQQVNNELRVEAPSPPLGRAATTESPAPSERMDTRATRRTGRRHQALAAVGVFDRSA
jgi:hypothetical protein